VEKVTAITLAGFCNRASDVFPLGARHDLAYRAWENIKKAGDAVKRYAFGIEHSDSNHFIVSQLRLRAFDSKGGMAMPSHIFPVIFGRAPAKICQMIVYAVTVVMACLGLCGRRTNKSQEHEPMDCSLQFPAIPLKRDVMPTIPTCSGFQDVWRDATSIVLGMIRPNAPLIADLVRWPFRNRVPNLDLFHCSPPVGRIIPQWMIPIKGEVDTITVSDLDAADKVMARRVIKHALDGSQPTAVQG
jgi:hypothetical protein